MRLDLALKRVYLLPIRLGAKTTEFRNATDYYVGKLLDVARYGKTPQEILDGLYDGSLPLYTLPIDEILFHESGSDNTLLVGVREIVYHKGYREFCIRLGEIKEGNQTSYKKSHD